MRVLAPIDAGLSGSLICDNNWATGCANTTKCFPGYATVACCVHQDTEASLTQAASGALAGHQFGSLALASRPPQYLWPAAKPGSIRQISARTAWTSQHFCKPTHLYRYQIFLPAPLEADFGGFFFLCHAMLLCCCFCLGPEGIVHDAVQAPKAGSIV